MDLRTVKAEAEEIRKLLDSTHSAYCLCVTIPPILFQYSSDGVLKEINIEELPKHLKKIRTIDIEELADALYDKEKEVSAMNRYELRLLQIIAGTTDNKEIVKRIRAAVRHNRSEDAKYKTEWEARDKEHDIVAIVTPSASLGDSKEICYNNSTKKEPSKPTTLSMEVLQHRIAKDFGD